jgi:signal transduction histidine kinase
MEQCAMVIDEIQTRMEGEFRMDGGLRLEEYPLSYEGAPIGKLSIETYGPFFYSPGESGFLKALNRFLLAAGTVFAILSIVVSVFLSTGISLPILKAAETARRIAGGDLTVRIPEQYKTRELRELSQSVNELAAALENGERWQRRLSSDIAHELRTPLTCLQGNIEAMIDGVWEPTAERLGSCHEEILRLHKLVEDLNVLSIVERDTLILHKTEFDLAALLSAAVERFVPLAREKGIEIRTELIGSADSSGHANKSGGPEALPVYADYDRLMQVFINLLSNAVKYTEAGSITIRGLASGGRCEVTVADTGYGIEADELPHIFERFYRSDKSRSRGTGGAGIGLSIAAAIVAAHNGTIGAESVPGEGSRFRVALERHGGGA